MDELEQLQNQIQDLQRKAEHLLTQKKAAAVAEVKRLIHTFGLTNKDIGLATNEPKKLVVPVKYRIGEQTWTGRGRAPKFIVEFQEQGGKLEDIQV